jgi:predicted metal-dependent phosphoesterase TrpH
LEYSRPAKIDLHIHTTASDGTLSPADVVARAVKLGLKAIAITDHDTVAGSNAALQAGIPAALEFLTGVEISAAPPSFYPGPGSFHLLGYAVDLENPILNQTLEKLQQARKNRNPEILKRLEKLGFFLSQDEIHRQVGTGQLGRPHIAQLLVKKQVVSSIDEAFEKLLGNGKPAYVDKYRVPCDRTIETIRKAGGIAVLAHPGLLSVKDSEMEPLFEKLKKMGLQGVEVYYPEHTTDQTRLFAELAQRHGLLLTGGSDFHGTIQPEIEMGSGKGDLSVPYELYEKLIRLIFQ